MDIYGAKFQEHCFDISRDIVYSLFTTFQLQYYEGLDGGIQMSVVS